MTLFVTTFVTHRAEPEVVMSPRMRGRKLNCGNCSLLDAEYFLLKILDYESMVLYFLYRCMDRSGIYIGVWTGQ